MFKGKIVYAVWLDSIVVLLYWQGYEWLEIHPYMQLLSTVLIVFPFFLLLSPSLFFSTNSIIHKSIYKISLGEISSIDEIEDHISEVKVALPKMKVGKESGPDGIPFVQ